MDVFREIVPEPRVVEGIQHENTDDSAVRIWEWLNTKGVTSWMVPKGTETYNANIAFVRIQSRYGPPLVVFPQDWVLYDLSSKEIVVVNRVEFDKKYKKDERLSVEPAPPTPEEVAEVQDEAGVGEEEDG